MEIESLVLEKTFQARRGVMKDILKLISIYSDRFNMASDFVSLLRGVVKVLVSGDGFVDSL